MQNTCRMYKSNWVQFRLFLGKDTIFGVFKCLFRWDISANDYGWSHKQRAGEQARM